MTRFLNQPIPYNYSSNNLIKLAVFVGLAVFLFLFLFKPVGINKGIKVDLIWACLLHGMVGGLLFLFHYGFATRFFKSSYWNMAREIALFLSLVVLAGLVNFFISQQINNDYHAFDWGQLAREIYNTFLVASIPMSIIWLWFHRKDVSVSGEMEQQSTEEELVKHATSSHDLILTFPSDEPLNLELRNLIYAQAQGNYVEFFEIKNGTLKKHIRRSTIKCVEGQIVPFNDIVKTHRSYLVNMGHVLGYQGNASGLQLNIRDTDQKVPVSRSRVSHIQEILSADA